MIYASNGNITGLVYDGYQFEIEYVGQLLPDYMMVSLDIWHVFTDTTLNAIVNFSRKQQIQAIV